MSVAVADLGVGYLNPATGRRERDNAYRQVSASCSDDEAGRKGWLAGWLRQRRAKGEREEVAPESTGIDDCKCEIEWPKSRMELVESPVSQLG